MKRFSVLVAAGLLLVTIVSSGPSPVFAQESEPAAPTDDPFGSDPGFPTDPGDPAMPDDFTFDENDFGEVEWDDAAFEEEFGDAPFNPNAPPEELLPVIIGVYGIALAIALFVGLGILALVCWLVSTALKSVPEQYREMTTGQVWFLMIPCFNLVWNFFVYQRVPRSFQNYFNAVGQTQHGDCGMQIGLWYAICAACSLIPCVNYIAGPASLVLLIIVIVKLWGLKGEAERLQSGDDGGMTSSTLDV